MFIDSPDLEALAAAMDRTDPVEDVYRPASREVGEDVERDLVRQMRAAGASEGLLDDVGTYEPAGGVTYVGVPDTSRHAAEAREIEYGTALHAPGASMRKVVMGRQDELNRDFGEAISRHLDRALR